MCDNYYEKIIHALALLCIPGRYSYFDFETNSRTMGFVENKFKRTSNNLNKNLGNSNRTRKEIKQVVSRNF